MHFTSLKPKRTESGFCDFRVLWLIAAAAAFLILVTNPNLQRLSPILFLMAAVLAILCSQDLGAICHTPLSCNASHSAFPSMGKESLLECMTHKKNQAWSCAGIIQAFYQNQNHPENAKSVSKHSTTDPQPNGVCPEHEKNEASQSSQAEQDRQTLIRIGWSILLYLSIRDEMPTWTPFVCLPLAILAATLLMLVENLYEYISGVSASVVQTSDTQNPPVSRGENAPS